MTSSFSIGIIGCGRIAARHVEACLAGCGIELAALVDPVEHHTWALAGRFRVSPFVTTRLEEALSRIDGAVIAAPNHLHERLAVECLRAGVHVLIEKPLAATVEQGEAICRAAAESGATAAVAYVTRFRQSVQLMKRLLDTGYFGAVRRFAYQNGTNGGWSPLSNYNLDRKATGGGVLVVTGTHFLDRMLDWFGYPESVALEHDSRGGPEANAAATFEFGTDGPRGIARFSKTVKLPGGFVMETEAGTVLLGDDAADPIRLRPADRPDVEIVIGPRDAEPAADEDTTALFRRQLEDFVAACRDGREPMVPARQGLESLRLIEQLYESGDTPRGNAEAAPTREAALV
jgi:predicted dehydrogenase